jgi:hypothetical protein
MRTDRWTDRQLTKLIVAFRRLSDASKQRYNEQIGRIKWPHLWAYCSLAETGEGKVKVKVKFNPEESTKAQRRGRDLALRFH